MDNLYPQETTKRFAVVLAPKIEPGAAINAASIVIGGLQSEGFAPPIIDASGIPHSAIQWNLVVLQSRSQPQIEKLVCASKTEEVTFVVFTASGRTLNNSFAEYKKNVLEAEIDFSDLLAVGLFGEDSVIRKLTKPFSVFK